MDSDKKKGTLFIVSTPIGNLGDITFRALDTLKKVDVIACEDTRTTRSLLAHFNITPPLLVSYEEHNEESHSDTVLRFLKEGKDAAVVSEGGTPLISDPGFRIVSKAISEGLRVEPVPGASAVIAALSASGASTDRFSFLGFLPRSSPERKKIYKEIAGYDHTVVFFESPHRIEESLKDLAQIIPSREIVLCREITKIYEEFIRGKAEDILKVVKDRGALKGEITLVIKKPEQNGSAAEILLTEDDLCDLLVDQAGMQASKAAAVIAKLSGSVRADVYEKIIKKNRRG